MKRKNCKTFQSGVNGRSLNFHILKKLEMANFNSEQKVKDFRYLNGTIHHGAVSNNPLIVLTH